LLSAKETSREGGFTLYDRNYFATGAGRATLEYNFDVNFGRIALGRNFVVNIGRTAFEVRSATWNLGTKDRGKPRKTIELTGRRTFQKQTYFQPLSRKLLDI
jgi:hypothetical protein